MSDNLPHATHHRYLPHQGIIAAAHIIKAGWDCGGKGTMQEMWRPREGLFMHGSDTDSPIFSITGLWKFTISEDIKQPSNWQLFYFLGGKKDLL